MKIKENEIDCFSIGSIFYHPENKITNFISFFFYSIIQLYHRFLDNKFSLIVPIQVILICQIQSTIF